MPLLSLYFSVQLVILSIRSEIKAWGFSTISYTSRFSKCRFTYVIIKTGFMIFFEYVDEIVNFAYADIRIE